MKESLAEKFRKIGATDKHVRHCYGDFYGPYFRHNKDKVKNVLEIGTSAGGGELVAFSEFFPNAKIYAVDIRELRFFPNSKDWKIPESIKFLCGDAYDSIFLDRHFSDINFDYILDDGPHSKESQVFTLNYFFNKLNKDGCIMVEDVDTDNIRWIYDHFLGDRRYLSVIDRRNCPNAASDENVLLYCPDDDVNTVLLDHPLTPLGSPT